MKAFSTLFSRLEATTRTREHLDALEAYFRSAPPEDAAWFLHFLCGRRGRRPVAVGTLRKWVGEATEFPTWVVEECHESVGDLAETLSLLWNHRRSAAGLGDDGPVTSLTLSVLVEERVLPLTALDAEAQRALLMRTLDELDHPGRFLYLKLLTGGFRLGISRTLAARALAAVAAVERPIMEHRLLSSWLPTAVDFARLLMPGESGRDPAQPYPFYLASPWEPLTDPLEAPADWQIEWKWDGIRAQLLRRSGQTVLWSRGEEIITHGYPEVVAAAACLPEGTVLDGELLVWDGDRPRSFQELQKRLGRKSVSDRLQHEAPVVFMAYDLLEHDGVDIRGQPLSERREHLEQVVSAAAESWRHRRRSISPLRQAELFEPPPSMEGDPLERFALLLSEALVCVDRDQVCGMRGRARELGVEGVMIKRRDSVYGAGRERGAWWKWKVEPRTIDAVLMAAQPGHGRRAGLFTDYTFGLWLGQELVSFGKAYSGLSAEEIQQVDRWVRENTLGRHGPVRSVRAELVFELAFDAVQESNRHKSGLALRFPRIARWRRDKVAAEADTLENLRRLL